MSTPPSPFNPSRQVERIREILVGRQMARLEQRLDRLERTPVTAAATPNSAPTALADGPRPDERFDQFRADVQTQTQALAAEIATESRLRREEIALLAARIQQTVDTLQGRIADSRDPRFDRQIASLREDLQQESASIRRKLEGEVLRRAEDLRELTARIEQIAQRTASPASAPSLQALEQRLARWLQQWQDQLTQYLQGREQLWIGHLRDELHRMRETTARSLAELDARKIDRADVQARMARVAAAARALAEASSVPGH